MFGRTGFFYSLAVLFALFLLARRIVHSPFGLSLRAIRNNPLRAAAMGIPVNRRLIAIYTLAAFYAGIAGALFTQTTALASLDVFSFERSADLMLMLVIGGAGYLYGGMIGAALFKMLQVFFSGITPQYWQFWIGLVFVVIVLIGRQRLHRWIVWAPNLLLGRLGARKIRTRHSRRGRAMTLALETRGLEKNFGGLKVTRELSLRIEAGASRSDRPNGAGKTTVINLLTGVLWPNAGRILLEGNDITDLPVHARVLGGLSRTFQNQSALCGPDAAGDHRPGGIGTPWPRRRLVAADGHARRRQWRDRRTSDALSSARGHERADRDTALRQAAPARDRGRARLQAARAAARRTRRRRARKRAPRYPRRRRGIAARVTVLLIEHDMDLVFSFADRISVLVNGALLVDGPPEEVARDARVKAVYLGEAADG